MRCWLKSGSKDVAKATTLINNTTGTEGANRILFHLPSTRYINMSFKPRNKETLARNPKKKKKTTYQNGLVCPCPRQS